MKKFFALLAIIGMFTFGASNVYAQPEGESAETEEVVENAEGDSSAVMEEPVAEEAAEEPAEAVAGQTETAPEEAEKTFHQVIKQKFIEGDPGFMAVVLVCLIFGLAIAIERVIYLSMATTNTKKLISDVEDALSSGGVEAAKEICRNTPGPIASIFYQGLDRSGEGIEMVEKSVEAYGGVQMGLLEKGLSWISLAIALAPMLGFMGTVIGMIGAFDMIAAANNISPKIVAEGIGMALITTVSGLIVAMILQFFYNLIVAKIDGIVNDMEDASISLIDLILKHNVSPK
ncbi:MAG: MotA/TolQ/ExbB proton channel family protein [Flavobacteriales bacterium]|nr:MotA/TolQ/ExbB proton channel family protein [Flavobacteriales bacterium]